jgi:hypothetical protein
MEVSTPAATSSTIAVPADGHTTVFVDGRLAWNGLKAEAYGAYQAGGYVYLTDLPGGGSHRESPPTQEADPRNAHSEQPHSVST